MTNNDIFKKLRVALQLRDDQICEILQLVDFKISKGEIGNFFRNVDHPKYVECGDQILRNFLNGLVIYLRGTKENPKNPMDVLEENKSKVKKTSPAKTNETYKKVTPKSNNNKDTKSSYKKTDNKKGSYNKSPLAGIKFNNGKKKD
ncbi:DUF1456 family protein [Myroides injenensis]|uniref:DUF1456 family protein n=1 Tax=Myroides injenensis TaxID=1183151 RepID=UPI000289F627|nr:DUF1456 family protein [Myroides injenensis]